MSLIRFGLLLTNALVGTASNGFIVLVICIDWVRSKRLSPTDLILSCLGLSRFLWEVIGILNVIISFFKQTNILSEAPLMMYLMWVFANTVSLWFAAWLSVLYFVKITIFSHPVFLQLKQRFSGLVPWLLLGSVLYSAVTTIIIITAWTSDFHTRKRSLLSNNSDSEIKILNSYRYLSILFTAPNFLPIAIFLSSSIFLIISLWKHIRQVQCNGDGMKDLNTQVHLTAIKVLASFTVLYLSSFVAITLRSLLAWRWDESNWIVILLETVGVLYPSGHAIIIIVINPKLKQAWMQMLHHLKCRRTEASS